MTDHIRIGDITPRIQHTGDGARTAFTYPFPVFADADLDVYEGGALKTLKTHYGVSGAGESGGGTVTFAAAPAEGAAVTIARNMSIARTTDFQDPGELRAGALNDELDRQTALIQQVNERAGRSVRRPPASASAADLSLPEPEAGKLLGWNAAADGLENKVPASAAYDAAAGVITLAVPVGASGIIGAAVADGTAGAAEIVGKAVADGKLNPPMSPAPAPGPLRRRLLMNSLLDAIAGGAALRVLDAVADPFADAGRIDAGASCNYTHDADGGFVHNPPAATGYGPNLITGAETYAASTALKGYGPEKAADGDPSTAWSCPQGVSQWWRVQFGKPVTMRKYRLHYVLHQLAAVTFEGSDDAVNWTRLDRVSLTPRSGRGWIERTFANETGYVYYRLTETMIRSPDHAGAWIIEMFEALPPKPAPHMTLVSTAFRAFAEPAAGYLMGVVEPVDAVAYGEDVLADLSRDDGATWEAAALAKIGVTEDGHDVVFGEVRFAAAAGRAVRSRWRMRNGKHVKLHGAILDAEG